MWESQKMSRLSGYQDIDAYPQSPSSRSRTNSLLASLVGVLSLASILFLSAITYRSLFCNRETVVVIPVLDTAEAEDMKLLPVLDTVEAEDVKLVPVLDVTSGGGWGKLPPPDTPDPKWDPEPSDSKLGLFDYAAVSVDSIPCAKVGK